jgi:hypothetical protein
MLSINKIKKLPRIMGGGVIFFKNNSSPITNFGDRSTINTSKYKINNKFLAFSLIELSIVLIIMGLLVAGITGGASLIDSARITSAKRELDDYVRDVFTFYSRVGRFPGDLQNSGMFGYMSGQTYTNESFSNPYNVTGIKAENAPFIELYLYEISSFKPDPSKVASSGYCDVTNSVLPLSKVYKNAALTYRSNPTCPYGSAYFRYGMSGKPAVEICFSDASIQIRDIIRKIDIKFDDGIYNTGNIRGYCRASTGGYVGEIGYSDATAICSSVSFYFNQ